MRAIAGEADVSREALREAVEALAQASGFCTQAELAGALAGATPYLRLFALARGATLLVKGAKRAQRDADPIRRATPRSPTSLPKISRSPRQDWRSP